MKCNILLFIILFCLCTPLYGQDKFEANEDQYFSNPDATVEKKNPMNAELDKTDSKKSVGISGEILSVFPYTVTRDYVFKNNDENNSLDPYMYGNLAFDARLTGNYKGFANLDLEYHPDTKTTDADVREIFVDFNYVKSVYFRAGKQVLKWGRCYLWNPTDVINIEKSAFIDRVRAQEGTYGLKMTIPFGTSVNIYGFADMNNSENGDNVGGAGKLEFLIGNSEMAFSAWAKKGYHPVAGYDFSTRIFGWDLVGEATGSYGSNTRKIRVVDGGIYGPTLETYREEDKFIPKAAIDFGREFDGRDISKRYSLKFEFFYNGAGYADDSFLRDTSEYIFDKPVTIEDTEGVKHIIPGGTKAAYLAGSGTYEPNYFSRYYAAIFTSVKQIFVSELTLNINGIMNISDYSFILSTGLSYQNINDFKAGLTVYTFIGKENREYTFSGNAASILLTAGIIF
ncbi:MAG: hypothetical protein V1874_08975 [Spirochaetota bacterium]